MGRPPTISVMVPTHRRAEMLEAAIEAVMAQTVAPIELIAVSDVLDPATAAVVAAANERASFPIRLVDNPDQPGASGSRNVGARQASGELLAFLDDDDLWTPEHLHACVHAIDTSGAVLAVAGIEVFDGNSSRPGIQLNPQVTSREAATRAHGVTGSNIVIQAAAFWSVGGFDPRLRHLNDRDFFYRFILAGMSYAISPQLTARYRKHDLGQLSGASEGRARGVAAYLAKHRRTLTLTDRRRLRYQMAVMRYRSTTPTLQRVRWLAGAAVNASYADVLNRASLPATKQALLSGRAFDSDSGRR